MEIIVIALGALLVLENLILFIFFLKQRDKKQPMEIPDIERSQGYRGSPLVTISFNGSDGTMGHRPVISTQEGDDGVVVAQRKQGSSSNQSGAQGYREEQQQLPREPEPHPLPSPLNSPMDQVSPPQPIQGVMMCPSCGAENSAFRQKCFKCNTNLPRR